MRARRALEEYNRALRKAYFNAMATVIQRWWRGFYSRKHIHDYYARKRYLKQVKERNDHIRAELNLEAERAIIVQRQVRPQGLFGWLLTATRCSASGRRGSRSC